jgi:hypothetical protein
MSVLALRNFFAPYIAWWLFARTYSEMVQGPRQDLASVSPGRHNTLFLNNFNNFDAKE